MNDHPSPPYYVQLLLPAPVSITTPPSLSPFHHNPDMVWKKCKTALRRKVFIEKFIEVDMEQLTFCEGLRRAIIKGKFLF